MGVPTVIDNWYLVLTFLISLAIQGTAFIISYTLQFDLITDFSGASNFLLIALITLLLHFTWDPQSFFARNVIVSCFEIIWATRLGGFLLFRVLKTGSDSRFDEMRSHFFRFAGFWTFQLAWAFTVSLPVTIINSPNVSAPSQQPGAAINPSFGSGTDIVGVIFAAAGFLIEAIGDAQKYRFKSAKPPKTAVNRKGVWSWSRHPNYAGEIFLWWGIWLIVIQPARSDAVSSSAKAALYGSVVSPVFITLLLLFVSGMPTAEKPVQQRYYLLQHGPKKNENANAWDDYKQYLNETSILIPLPPALYRPLPTFVKKYILLDLPMFNFDEHKDGQKAIEEERKKNSESA